MFTVSKISLQVSEGVLVDFSSTISCCLILSTAFSAFCKNGKAYCKSRLAISCSCSILFLLSTQASVTALTCVALASAFLFSTSSSLSNLSVASVLSLSLTSSFLRDTLSSSTPRAASARRSRPFLMLISSTSMASYFFLYTS